MKLHNYTTQIQIKSKRKQLQPTAELKVSGVCHITRNIFLFVSIQKCRFSILRHTGVHCIFIQLAVLICRHAYIQKFQLAVHSMDIRTQILQEFQKFDIHFKTRFFCTPEKYLAIRLRWKSKFRYYVSKPKSGDEAGCIHETAKRITEPLCTHVKNYWQVLKTIHRKRTCAQITRWLR